MPHQTQFESQVKRWTDAGLIDAQTASRILEFEASHERRTSLNWPVLLAMAFGGILLAAGITLFVAAHWAELSPASRFTLVLLMVGVFHLSGALLAERFSPLSTTLHAMGTITLGAGIYLTAQIFNLHENWATGVLLWALGAGIAYCFLREWPQAAALALLAPAWLICQWSVMTEWNYGSDFPLGMGLILISLTYLSARVGEEENTARRTLVWLGGISLLPCIAIAIYMAVDKYHDNPNVYGRYTPVPATTLFLAWTIAVVGPLLLAFLLRRRAVWINLIYAAWAYAIMVSARIANSYFDATDGSHRNFAATIVLYALCALGAVGLVTWGLYEKRKERLNLGILGFAISVLSFYFDGFMGKLGRSASLLILGVLCLAGGYALEITRRKLIVRMEQPQ